MESKGKDLSNLYNLRQKFTIIGLTGHLGSGCESVANQLSRGFDHGNGFTKPTKHFKAGGSRFRHNAYRKHRIVYEYADQNFLPYAIIQYRDILTLFLLQYPIDQLKEYLGSVALQSEFEKSKLGSCFHLMEILPKLDLIRSNFDSLAEQYKAIGVDEIETNGNWISLHDLYFGSTFKDFSEKIHSLFGRDAELNAATKRNHSGINYHKAFQVIATNLRRSGHPYASSAFDPDKIFTIADLINKIIKSHRKANVRTQIVIDSLKNPLEIMFFKQRFSAFYAVAVNRDEVDLELGRFTTSKQGGFLKKLREEEYEGDKEGDFSKLKISQCLQLADIHISFIDDPDLTKTSNQDILKRPSTPDFGWKDQLLKYVSLIDHPGLVTPSPEERCMQLAFTAKHNSGCISRHVGAAITDENFSVRAIGWNNTSEGQVPCVLRNAHDLLDRSFDLQAFTDYERDHENDKFINALENNFRNQIKAEQPKLKGRHACYCFKSLQNSIEDGKNQVHTRSLHAEENAFLQVVKYGGLGINGGKLFSTASPCELCAKKARQLGIKEIYYIDPYPGISNQHILDTGEAKITPKLFSGAIGSAYHWLYEPMMPYKDELTLILGNPIDDLVKQHKKSIEDAEKEIKKKDNEIARLNEIIEKLNTSTQKCN